MPGTPSRQLATSGRDQGLKLKDLANNDRRDIQRTSALASVSPSVLPSLDLSFQPVRQMYAQTWVSRGCGKRRSNGGSWKPES